MNTKNKFNLERNDEIEFTDASGEVVTYIVSRILKTLIHVSTKGDVLNYWKGLTWAKVNKLIEKDGGKIQKAK